MRRIAVIIDLSGRLRRACIARAKFLEALRFLVAQVKVCASYLMMRLLPES